MHPVRSRLVTCPLVQHYHRAIGKLPDVPPERPSVPHSLSSCFPRWPSYLAFVLPVVWVSSYAAPARGFPPYRSTDAAPADPWELEPRLGLLQIQRKRGDTELTSPLLRLNLGFPGDFEIVTEAEYVPASREIGEAAAGAKWVPLRRRFAIGVEALTLLPLPSRSGAGVEATSIASYFTTPLRLHLNLGAFADTRGSHDELGHKASMLGELDVDRFRPGIEVVFKSIRGEDAEVSAGGGLIWNLGALDLRAGLHVGITEAAADLRTSFWITSKLPLVGD